MPHDIDAVSMQQRRTIIVTDRLPVNINVDSTTGLFKSCEASLTVRSGGLVSGLMPLHINNVNSYWVGYIPQSSYVIDGVREQLSQLRMIPVRFCFALLPYIELLPS